MKEEKRLEDARKKFEQMQKEKGENASGNSKGEIDKKDLPGMNTEAFRKNLGCGG